MAGKIKYICPDNHISCDINLGECPVCHKKMIPEMSKDWMEILVEKKELWHEKAMEEFPAVISFEYWRLREQIAQKHPYGAVFMIKDLMETVLKYYVLVSYAWGKNADVSEFKQGVLPLITTPNLSLGSWMDLGRKIIAFSKTENPFSLPTELYACLSCILKFYDKNNFVNWRNENIGHGALSDIDNLMFQQDIEKKTKQFFELFCKLESSVPKVALSSESRVLQGYKNARNLENESSLYILFLERDEKISIDPFISIIDGGVFFFDNQKKEKWSQLQCYPSGVRLTRSIELFSELSKMLKTKHIDPNMVINDEYRSIEEDRTLNLMGFTSEYTEPSYLLEWFQDKVNEYSKGIFVLEMSRGMGKSTFAERVNLLRDKPLIIAENLDVRTYHVSRSQLMGNSDFESTIETQWMTDYYGKVRVAAPRIRDFEKDTHTAGEMLSAFLSDYLSYTRKKRNKSSIALFLDGLDEITDEKIWEYIPDPDALEDGIYVFLSYRQNDKENPLTLNTAEHLKNIQATDKLSVTPDSNQNIQFLRKYIDDNLSPDNRTYCDQLLSAAGNKILYLSIVCRLAASGYPISELTEETAIITCYFDEIRKQYGEKEYHRFCELGALFCTYGVEESLSINDIAFILYDGQVTYDLLGKLSDLMPFLNVQRGTVIEGTAYKGENRYRLANSLLGDQLKKIISDWKTIVAAIKEIAINNAADADFSEEDKYVKFSEDELVAFDRGVDVVNKKILGFQGEGAIDEGSFCFITNNPSKAIKTRDINKRTDKYTKKEAQIEYISKETTLLLLVHVSDYIGDTKLDEDIHAVLLDNLDGIIVFLDNMSYSKRMLVIESVRKAGASIAHLIERRHECELYLDKYYHITELVFKQLIKTERFQEAVNYYIHVLEYLSQNILQDKLTAEGYTNSVLLNLGDMYRQNGQHQDAYNMYMAAYRNLYALNGSFIKARASEGIAYSSLKLGNLNAASIYIEHYVWEEYLDKHKSDMDLIFYSRCLITRASIIDALAGREASGPWYDLAFNIITNLFRENSLEDYELLIDLYFFCGDSYSTLIQNGHTYNDWAAIYYDQIVYMYGKCEQRGEFVNLHKYVLALEKLIKAKKRMGIENNESLEDKLSELQKRLVVI